MPRFWDCALFCSLLTITRHIPAPPYLPLQHQAAPLPHCSYDVLCVPPMVPAWVFVQESDIMVDIGDSGYLVDRPADRRGEERLSSAKACRQSSAARRYHRKLLHKSYRLSISRSHLRSDLHSVLSAHETGRVYLSIWCDYASTTKATRVSCEQCEDDGSKDISC